MRKSLWLCAVPAALYVCFVAPRLGLPGLYADEASAPLPACAMLGIRSPAVGGASYLSVGGFLLPLGRQNYHGAVESYLIAPFIALMGNTARAVRAYCVTVGVAILIAFFFFAQEIFETPGRALFAAALLAAHPAFISGSRFGLASSSLIVLFLVASAHRLLVWRRARRARDLYGSCFLAGCGLASYAYFVFVLPPLLVLGLWGERSYWSGRLREARGRTLRTLLAAFGMFLLGSLPLNLYLLSQLGRPLTEMIHSKPMIDNRAYLKNLGGRLENVRQLMQEDYFLGWQFPYRERPRFRFHWPFFLLSLALTSFYAVRSVRARYLLAALALILAVSPFTTTKFLPQHVYSIVPLGVLIMAFAALTLADKMAPWASRVFLSALLSAGLALDFPRIQTYLRDMSGVSADYTERIYDVAKWLDESDVERVHILDWGMHSNLQFLMRREIGIVPLWPDSYGAIADFKKHLLDRGNVYLGYEREEPNFNSAESRQRFFSELARMRKRVEVIRRFAQGDGRNGILVFRVL